MIEWIFAGASTMLIAGIVAFLAYEAMFGEKGPPDLTVMIERLEMMSNGTLVVVALSNTGDKAAAEVAVEAVVAKFGRDPVRKQISFDYVAAQAVRRGAFVIERGAVEASNIEVTIQGFVEP